MPTRYELRKIKEAKLTYEIAHGAWAYSPETGEFRSKKTGRKIATPTGSGEYKYGQLRINGHIYNSNRVAWMMFHGKWPDGNVDHKNNDHGDDRIDNLRDSTQAQNLGNQRRRVTSKTGIKGVYWDSSRQKWHAQIGYNGKGRTLGRFVNKEDAAAAYARAAVELYGEYARLE